MNLTIVYWTVVTKKKKNFLSPHNHTKQLSLYSWLTPRNCLQSHPEEGSEEVPRYPAAWKSASATGGTKKSLTNHWNNLSLGLHQANGLQVNRRKSAEEVIGI